MQFFIGIVPPEEYKEKIKKFQRNWASNSLPDVVEPHITVKAQGGLNTEKNWLKEVEKICQGTSPFKLTLNKPAFFGEVVMYLTVDCREIYELHRKIVNVISPGNELIKKYLELEHYVPHLTLGQTNWGLTNLELKEMARIAEEELSPYPTFIIDFLRVYQEVEPHKYRKLLDIQLKKD
ncbi:2'-5' RNA ligase family protein [Bacillus sp. AK128]